MSDLAKFWSENRWTRAYGYRPTHNNPYTLGYHIAQDIGAGGDLYWPGPVPALRSGVVVGRGRSRSIGGFVVIRADADGLYDSYTHLYDADLPPVGRRVKAGDDLPRLARSTSPAAGHDYMGSASSGMHLHFGVATSPINSYVPLRGADRDPRPIIRAALAQTAGGISRPIEEDDMPLTDAEKNEIAERTAALVWKQTVGSQQQSHLQYGRAGDVLALAAARAGKAVRGIAALDEIASLPAGQAPSAELLDRLAADLKASLPAATAKATAAELAKRLAS